MSKDMKMTNKATIGGIAIPMGSSSYITEGRKYTITRTIKSGNGNLFNVIDDKGVEIIAKADGCSHIKGKGWALFRSDEVDRISETIAKVGVLFIFLALAVIVPVEVGELGTEWIRTFIKGGAMGVLMGLTIALSVIQIMED